MNCAPLVTVALHPRLPDYLAAEARLSARGLLQLPGRGGPDSAVPVGTTVAASLSRPTSAPGARPPAGPS